MTARARATDPHTSHVAAAIVNVTALQLIVMETLQEIGRSTSLEIARHAKVPPWSISPRMKPLQKAAMVYSSGVKLGLNSSGNPRELTAYELTDKGRKFLRRNGCSVRPWIPGRSH